MRVPLGWLRDYVDISVPVEDLADMLDMSGTKVEAIHHPGAGTNGVVVAQVLAIEPHPNADSLTLVDVSAGGDPQRVVCGAKNFRVGDLVPLARTGARLPEMEITERKIRGQVSNGMLCSASELGISRDHSGILVLPPDAEPGSDVVELLGLDEAILELEITPNRPDCMAVLGVAREVAALTGGDLRPPTSVTSITARSDAGGREPRVTVDVRDPDGCARYSARYVEGVTVAPSPAHIAARLVAAGVRPSSSGLDITKDYVMLELGQPLHVRCRADRRRLDRRPTSGRRSGSRHSMGWSGRWAQAT